MLNCLKKLFLPTKNAFILEEVDHLRKVIVMEDKQLGLRVEIPIGDKPLKHATIVGPYTVLLTYEDGSQAKKKILK